jgi:hypothetical protein
MELPWIDGLMISADNSAGNKVNSVFPQVKIGISINRVYPR